MFSNLFSSSPAVWGSLIAAAVALPILIHLINLMRHKRVQWAAMDFLLKSYKKNRNWVWLKQLLLLMSRIAALLLALFMLGNVGCDDDRISKLLGGSSTHHYVILDDSFSMSDRGADGSAFDRARATLSLIASRAKNRSNQFFTLIRFSSSRPVPETNLTLDSAEGVLEQAALQQADINAELVDALFDQRLEDEKSKLNVSALSVNLDNGAELVSQLISQRQNENAIVYVLSDFRKKDWDNAAELDRQLGRIRETEAAIELISCARTEQTNLAVTELQPAGNVRVAGTLMMQVTVKNCSDESAEKIQLQIASKNIASVTERRSDPERIEMTAVSYTHLTLPTIYSV